jgi:hypothetical protein
VFTQQQKKFWTHLPKNLEHEKERMTYIHAMLVNIHNELMYGKTPNIVIE